MRPHRPLLPFPIPFIVFLVVLVGAAPRAARATTFVVTNTSDAIMTGDGVSLREAITAANTNAVSGDAPAGSAGLDTITFNIPGSGVKTIKPASEMDINEPVFIDGYTQPGASMNTLAAGSNAVLAVELDGTSTTVTFQFNAGSDGSTVRGLVLNRSSNQLWATNVANLTITGNFIGTTADGLSATSSNVGLRLEGVTSSHIGGTSPGERNTITCNNLGVWFYDTTQNKPNGNVVQGNYLGTGATGLQLQPAGTVGNNVAITVEAAVTSMTIGGTAAGAGNIISGNSNGIELQVGAGGVVIAGNRIGVDVTGAALGNVYYAISLGSGSKNVVGGTAAGAGNVIRNNGHGGAFTSAAITAASGTNDTIEGNSIDDSGGAGIYINASVVANDNPDVDGVQNYPVIASAVSDGATTTVKGTLQTKASQQYRVELFASPACNALHYGEGRTLLGATNVMTDGTGKATIDLGALPAASGVVTATATDPNGNTSQFSACTVVTMPPPADMTIVHDMVVIHDLAVVHDLAMEPHDLAMPVNADLAGESVDSATPSPVGAVDAPPDMATTVDAPADLAAAGNPLVGNPAAGMPHGAPHGCACSLSPAAEGQTASGPLGLVLAFAAVELRRRRRALVLLPLAGAEDGEVDRRIRRARGATGARGDIERRGHDPVARVIHGVGDPAAELAMQRQPERAQIAAEAHAQLLAASQRIAVAAAIPVLAQPRHQLLPRRRANEHAFVDEGIDEIGLHAESLAAGHSVQLERLVAKVQRRARQAVAERDFLSRSVAKQRHEGGQVGSTVRRHAPDVTIARAAWSYPN